MICLEVSDQFSDITIIVEFFRWTIQLETSLHFLLKLLFNFMGKRTVRKQGLGTKFNLM